MSILTSDDLFHDIQAAKINERNDNKNLSVQHFDVSHEEQGVYKLRILRLKNGPMVRPVVVVTAHTEDFNANATVFQTTHDTLIVRIYDTQGIPSDCPFDIVVTFPF